MKLVLLTLILALYYKCFPEIKMVHPYIIAIILICRCTPTKGSSTAGVAAGAVDIMRGLLFLGHAT